MARRETELRYCESPNFVDPPREPRKVIINALPSPVERRAHPNDRVRLSGGQGIQGHGNQCDNNIDDDNDNDNDLY